MYIYILNILFIIIIGFIFRNNQSKKVRLNLVILLFLQLSLISILRSENVGIDLISYKMYFKDIISRGFPTLTYMKLESGYVVINSCLGIISNNFRILMIFVAIVSLGAFSKFIYSYSNNIALSFYLLITMGFFANSLNLYRQILALAFVLFSVKYIIKENLFKFLICIAIAISFHSTAIVFLPMYFIRNIKITPINVIKISFISILITVFSSNIINLFMTDKYSYYNQKLVSGEGYKLLTIYFIIMISAFKFKNKLYKLNNNKLTNILLLASVFSVNCQILATKFSLFSRITLYFSVFIIILVPNIINTIENKWIKILANYIVIILYFIFYIISLYMDSSGIVPYTFFFK